MPVLYIQGFDDDVIRVIDKAVDVAGIAQVSHGKGEVGLCRRPDAEFRHAANDAG